MERSGERKLGERLLDGWLAGAHLEFVDDAAREKYRERAQLIVDTIRLVDAGRIPVIPAGTGRFAFDYGPITWREAMTDFDKAFAAYARQYEDTDFDAYVGPELIFPAGMFEALRWRRILLPGRDLPADGPFQFAEGEYMKADEYDEFLDDPSDWVLRTYLPRLSPELEPLAGLPPLRDVVMYYQGLPELVLAVAQDPGVVAAVEALRTSGEAVRQWNEYLVRLDQELGGRLGLPHLVAAVCHAPFDIISNYYRGSRGAMLDMFRQPQKMVEMAERLLPWQLRHAVEGARALGSPIVTIYIYQGADNLMSQGQFEELYWPTLKKLILGLVDEGLLVWVFTQGTYDSRLVYFREIPAGTCLIHLESGTDAFRAKEVLAGRQCIEGNVPNSLLATGSVDDVEAYCRDLVDVCGRGGGFMMDFSAVLDEARPENVKKMIEVARGYKGAGG